MLSVKSLSFSFKHRPLFKELSFDLSDGDVFHLTGENGTGKSTLMSILAGFRSPTLGEIAYFTNGKEIEDRREFLEYLSAEANGLYMKMDATQNLNFWSQARGLTLDPHVIKEELTSWGLGHELVRINFSVEKFSTGMRRRLALARLNLSNAKVWLLDEPIYGLDTKGIDKFREILTKHRDQGGSCLVISHDTAPLKNIVTKQITLQG